MPQRVPARARREYDLGVGQTHVLGFHDLEGVALLEHPVLVDTRAVGKGVGPDNRLVGRHRDPHQPAHQAAGRHNLARLHPAVQAKVVAPRADGHDDLFQRGIARPLAQTVERALGLARPILDGRQRVRHRHPQIVVAVDAEDRLTAVGHLVQQVADQFPELLGHRVPHRVGYIDRRRPGGDGRLHHLAQVLKIRPRRVHRRELHVFAERLGQFHRLHRHLEHLVPPLAQLALQVDLRGADKGVDARS